MRNFILYYSSAPENSIREDLYEKMWQTNDVSVNIDSLSQEIQVNVFLMK